MDSEAAVDALWGNISKRAKEAEQVTTAHFLKKNPVFEDLRTRELASVAGIVHERTYEAGEFLFELDQPGAAMFIVKTGEVEIFVPSEGEKSLTLATLADGDFLGELALLDKSPRSASAKAVRRTEALALFREDLHALLEQHPAIGYRIYRALSMLIGQRLKATNEQLRRTGQVRKP